MRTGGLSVVALALTLAVAPEAFADPIFRWVDAGGVVNYGNKPPEVGSAAKTVRAIVAEPAVTVHESAQEKAARQERALTSELAEEARLKRQLLEQQIDTERARAEALRAQTAGNFASSSCDPQTSDCDSERYLVGWSRRAPRFLPGTRKANRPMPRGPNGGRVQVSVPARAF